MNRKKIVFVDDEPNLLKSLERGLRKQKKFWDMIFVPSAKQVLDILTTENIDIIVSDYKMPEMNGLALFAEIQKKYPHIKRILLSGQSEKEIFLQGEKIAHKYLEKPCSIDEIVQAISSQE